MRKRILISVAVFIIVSGVGFADDDNEVTKLVVSKGLGGGNSEIAYARNGRNLSSVIVWSQGSSTKFESKIYAALVKPKSNGTFKISKPRLISNKTDFNYKASIAFNEITNSYMVVWSSQVKNLDTHILGRKLSATGRPKGGIVKIAAEVNAQNSSPRSLPIICFLVNTGPRKVGSFLLIAKTGPSRFRM